MANYKNILSWHILLIDLFLNQSIMKTLKKDNSYLNMRINFTWDMNFWAKNWGISVCIIAEAIRDTGSNKLRTIRKYLEQKSFIAD